MAPEPGSSPLVTQDEVEKMVGTDFSGNWTLEQVQRNQSGTYGCRAEDFDAKDDAELSQTLELRVACESPGRARLGGGGGGGWHPLPPGLHPRSPASLWSRCLLPPGDPALASSRLPHQAARALFPKHRPDILLLQNLPWLPSALWRKPRCLPAAFRAPLSGFTCG